MPEIDHPNDDSFTSKNLVDEAVMDEINKKVPGYKYSGIAILIFASVGIVINTYSIILLFRKQTCSMFHKMVKLLATSDIMVVIGAALIYGLPETEFWNYYTIQLFPVIVPYVMPMTQIAMMISVYCTMVMSFERYVRIGRTCRLKASGYITDDNFRYYVIAIIIGPILFYIPRFFEIVTVYKPIDVTTNTNCSSFRPSIPVLEIPCIEGTCSLQIGQSIGIQDPSDSMNMSSPFLVQLRQIVKRKKLNVDTTTPFSIVKNNFSYDKKLRHDFQMLGILDHQLQPNMKHKKGLTIGNDRRNKTHGIRNPFIPMNESSNEGKVIDSSLLLAKKLQRRNAKLHFKCILNDMINAFQQIKRNATDTPLLYPAIELTPLRNNQWYYRIYCMAINAIFACALPLGLLLYLNFYTVIALRDLGRETIAAASSRNNNARCKNCMLTVKYNQPTLPNKNDTLPSEEEKPLQSLDNQDTNRDYHDDSFYIPVSHNDSATIRDNNENLETDKNSSNSYLKDNNCCIALERIKINVDKHCLSENKDSEVTTNTKHLTSSILQSKVKKNLSPRSIAVKQESLQLENEIDHQSQPSKKKANGFMKSSRSRINKLHDYNKASKNYPSTEKEIECNKENTEKQDSKKKRSTINKSCGCKSFESTDHEILISESRKTHVKSLPNLKGLGKKTNKKETQDQNRYDGIISNGENKTFDSSFCKEPCNMVLDKRSPISTSKQTEPLKYHHEETSKVSFGFNSFSRRNCPHRKHLLCRKFHGEASEERDSADFSSSSISGHNWERNERTLQKRISYAMIQSSCANKSETASIGHKSDRIWNILTKKSLYKTSRDGVNPLRYDSLNDYSSTCDNWKSGSSQHYHSTIMRSNIGRQRSESLKYYNPQVRNESLLLLANNAARSSNVMYQCKASKLYRRKYKNISKKQLCDRLRRSYSLPVEFFSLLTATTIQATLPKGIENTEISRFLINGNHRIRETCENSVFLNKAKPFDNSENKLSSSSYYTNTSLDDSQRNVIAMSEKDERNVNTESSQKPCSNNDEDRKSNLIPSDFKKAEQSISMQVIHRPNCGPRCIHSRESVGVLRRGEARITRIALAIVWLFIFCHMWRLIPNAYEFFFKPEKDPDWLLYMIGISHTLIVFNSAVNVLLYKVL